MTKTINDGGPAFPWAVNMRGGMSLRDYFAAKAPITLADAVVAAGIASSAPSVDCAVVSAMIDATNRAKAFAMLAQLRLDYADAMIQAREVKP